jgi:PiT family inorganic phosphate transporter
VDGHRPGRHPELPGSPEPAPRWPRRSGADRWRFRSTGAIIAALAGAIAWNLLTWYYGIPSSSSHALIGSLLGAGIATLGMDHVHWYVLRDKVVLPLFLSPAVGFLLALGLMRILIPLLRQHAPGESRPLFRRTQILSASSWRSAREQRRPEDDGDHHARPHERRRHLGFHVPTWVLISCALAMGAGTLAGGKRIIHTMGTRFAHLEPIHGFAAENGGRGRHPGRLAFRFSAQHNPCDQLEHPGRGCARRLNAVRWGVARTMVGAWFLTIPVSALLGFLVALAERAIFGAN